MSATANPVGEVQTPRTDYLVRWVRRTGTFRELIPADAALGWPAVTRVRDQVFLTVPVFAQRAGADGVVALYPPFATITLGWEPVRIAGYRDLRSSRSWTADVSQPVGRFPHPELGVSEEDYLALRREVFHRYDELCAALAAGGEPAAETDAELSRLLRIVLEPSLEPHYRRLAPEFFARYLPSEPIATENHPPSSGEPAPSSSPAIPRLSLEEVAALIRATEALTELSGSESARAQLGRIRDRRTRTQGQIACVGTMKSGRTTLANILLGDPVLPSRVDASTAGLVRVVAGPGARLHVGSRVFADGALAEGWAAVQAPDGDSGDEQAVLTLDNEWLRETAVELLDTPGIGTPGAELAERLAFASDVAVMAVAAPRPFGMDERAFLDRAAAHGVPVLVVITQLDRVDADERGAVAEFITERAASHPAVDRVLVPAGGDGRPTTEELRLALVPALTQSARRDQRARQTVLSLRQLGDELEQIGEERIEIARLDGEQRARMARSERLALEAAEREWVRLGADLERTRIGFAETVQTWFDQQRVNVEERLSFELAHSSNPKSWWELDLPYRLRRELTDLAASAEHELRSGLEAELRTLSERVTALAGDAHSFAPAAVSGATGAPAVELKTLALTDVEHLRLGALAAGAAGVLMLGIGVPIVLAGIGGGLAGKQLAGHQKGTISAELGLVLNDAFGRLRQTFTDEMLAAYDDATDQLRQRHEGWHQDRLRALEQEDQSEVQDVGARLVDGARLLRERLRAIDLNELASS